MKLQVSGLNNSVTTGVSSLISGPKFRSDSVDVPQKVRHAPGMNQQGMARAGEYVSEAMTAREWNAVDLAEAANIPDPSTVRTFVNGKTWPRSGTRGAIERALGLEAGSIERVAKSGRSVRTEDFDEVVAAIRRTALSRRDQAELELHYLNLLEGLSARGSETG